MSSLTAWMISLTLSLCLIILAAGASMPGLHMAASGAVSLVFSVLAIREHNALVAADANKFTIGGSTARHIGLVWAWGALGILVTYSLILEQRWPEWPAFFTAFLFAGAGSLLFAGMLDRDAQDGSKDQSVMKFGRTLVLLQLAGVVIGIVSLFVDGKFPRDVAHADWAACNIFFFGALAIIAISLNALLSTKK